jgi:steroid delta-isomerase-like uncharacterized protein
MDEVYTADFVNHDPTAPDVRDLDGLKGYAATVFAAMPDFHVTSQDMVAEGDKVVSRWTASATQTGQLLGIPPTGNPLTWTGISVYRLADGKVRETWWSKDVAGMLEQLGVMAPTRGSYTWGEPLEVTGDPGDLETNRATVQRIVDEVMNQQNLAVVDELFAANYLMHDPAVPMEVKGPEGFKQWAGMMLDPYFSDSHVSADLIAEGDKVAVHWTWMGTHAGEFMGIGPTGRQIAVKGITIHRFADGELVESWASYDMMGMMQQLTAEEWPAQGVWITTVPTPLGNMIIKGSWMAQDDANTRLTGEFEQINTYPVLIDVYPDSEETKYGGGLAVKIGLNREEVVGIGIVTGTFELVGPDLAQGQGTGAYYVAAQDADQDGFPDEGQEPVVCVPWEWTVQRLTMMPGCLPTPIP